MQGNLEISGGAAAAGGGGGTPDAHAASHQDGGTDEISVADLSGLLADAQTPLAHTHPQSDITNLVADLALKAPLASPAFTGVPTAPTAAAGTSTTQLATTAFVTAADGTFVVGPASAVDLRIPIFDGTTGKLVKDNGVWIITAGGLLTTGAASTDLGFKLDTTSIGVNALALRAGNDSDFGRLIGFSFTGIRASANSSGPAFQQRKARGTPGSEGNVLLDDELGTFTFLGYNNGGYRTAGNFTAFAAANASGAGTDLIPTYFTWRTTNLALAFAERMRLSSEGALTVTGSITHGSSTLIRTTTTLTDNAAAALGTLSNAPAAGNPTKWVQINDNGTTRFIPAW